MAAGALLSTPAALAVLGPAALQRPSGPAALLLALPASAGQLGTLEEAQPRARCGAAVAQEPSLAAAAEHAPDGSSATAGAAQDNAAVPEDSPDTLMEEQAGPAALEGRQESCASAALSELAVAPAQPSAVAAPPEWECGAGPHVMPIAALCTEKPLPSVQTPLCTNVAVLDAGPAADIHEEEWQVRSHALATLSLPKCLAQSQTGLSTFFIPIVAVPCQLATGFACNWHRCSR